MIFYSMWNIHSKYNKQTTQKILILSWMFEFSSTVCVWRLVSIVMILSGDTNKVCSCKHRTRVDIYKSYAMCWNCSWSLGNGLWFGNCITWRLMLQMFTIIRWACSITQHFTSFWWDYSGVVGCTLQYTLVWLQRHVYCFNWKTDQNWYRWRN